MLQDFYSASDQLGTLCMKMLRKETAFSYRLIDLDIFALMSVPQNVISQNFLQSKSSC